MPKAARYIRLDALGIDVKHQDQEGERYESTKSSEVE